MTTQKNQLTRNPKDEALTILLRSIASMLVIFRSNYGENLSRKAYDRLDAILNTVLDGDD